MRPFYLIQILPFLLTGILISIGCKHDHDLGPVSTREQDLDAFERLHIESLGNVTLRTGSTNHISVETHLWIHDRMTIRVVDNTLEVIYNESHNNNSNIDRFDIVITAPTYKEITMDGVLDLRSEDPIVTEALDIHLDGVGDLTFLDIETTSCNARIDGVGDITLAGIARSGEVVLSDVGNVFAFDMQYDSCRAVIHGVGNIQVAVSEYLDARITGVGDIVYDGNPVVDKDVSGQGDVRKR